MAIRFGDWPRWLRDFAPLVIWMGLIFALSAQPVLVEIENKAGERLIYKSSHVVTYAILFWLWWRALAPKRQVTWPSLMGALGLTVWYGISDEFHQLFVPGRSARAADVLFDTSGALAMILLLRWLKWLPDFPETIPLLRPKVFDRP